MFYIKVSNDAEAQKVINALKEMGFTNSMWSANMADCKGIATYINPLENTRAYIILNESMMCSDPRRSWITNRKEVASLDVLLGSIKDYLTQLSQ
jgi:hypothetical protein